MSFSVMPPASWVVSRTVEHLLREPAGARCEAHALEVGVELVGPDDLVALAVPGSRELCFDLVV